MLWLDTGNQDRILEMSYYFIWKTRNNIQKKKMKTDATHCNQTDNTKFVLRTKTPRKTSLTQMQRMNTIEKSTDLFTHQVLKLF